MEHAAGDLHMAHPLILLVAGDFIDPRAEFLPAGTLGRIRFQRLHEFRYPLELQRRAEPHREDSALLHRRGNGVRRKGAGIQEFLQQCFIAQRQLLGILRGQDTDSLAELASKIPEYRLPLRSRKIHFVHEQQGGNIPLPEELPHRQGVALYPGAAADHQNGAVQHIQGSLHLCGKIHMARGVQQRGPQPRQLQYRLLGENRNAPLPLQ